MGVYHLPGGSHGSLTAEGVSSDVEDRGDSDYRTSVLIDDGSEQGLSSDIPWER